MFSGITPIFGAFGVTMRGDRGCVRHPEASADGSPRRSGREFLGSPCGSFLGAARPLSRVNRPWTHSATRHGDDGVIRPAIDRDRIVHAALHALECRIVARPHLVDPPREGQGDHGKALSRGDVRTFGVPRSARLRLRLRRGRPFSVRRSAFGGVTIPFMSLDERAFFNERPESRRAKYQCPRCRRTNEYSVRWVRRSKKDRLPGGAD